MSRFAKTSNSFKKYVDHNNRLDPRESPADFKPIVSPLPEILLNLPQHPILAIGLPVTLGISSGLITASKKRGAKSAWYNNMVAPPGNPPKWAFGPTWTLLYAGMGFASHLAWKAYDGALTPSTTATAVKSLELYYAQLGLNMLWTPLFFGLHQKGLALVDILALTGTVGLWAKQLYNLGPIPLGAGQLGGKGSWSVNPAWFTVPYLAWLSYATYLNLGYLTLNPKQKKN